MGFELSETAFPSPAPLFGAGLRVSRENFWQGLQAKQLAIKGWLQSPSHDWKQIESAYDAHRRLSQE